MNMDKRAPHSPKNTGQLLRCGTLAGCGGGDRRDRIRGGHTTTALAAVPCHIRATFFHLSTAWAVPFLLCEFSSPHLPSAIFHPPSYFTQLIIHLLNLRQGENATRTTDSLINLTKVAVSLSWHLISAHYKKSFV